MVYEPCTHLVSASFLVEHGAQQTVPQLRQWWRRKRRVKGEAQRGQTFMEELLLVPLLVSLFLYLFFICVCIGQVSCFLVSLPIRRLSSSVDRTSHPPNTHTHIYTHSTHPSPSTAAAPVVGVAIISPPPLLVLVLVLVVLPPPVLGETVGCVVGWERAFASHSA
jgi:hypothetical protein